METINAVFLSGYLPLDAKFKQEDGLEIAHFEVETFRAVGKGRDKVRTPEFHQVRLFNPNTLGRHLKRGKSVIIQGRIVPSAMKNGIIVDSEYILASSVTFPGVSRDE